MTEVPGTPENLPLEGILVELEKNPGIPELDVFGLSPESANSPVPPDKPTHVRGGDPLGSPPFAVPGFSPGFGITEQIPGDFGPNVAPAASRHDGAEDGIIVGDIRATAGTVASTRGFKVVTSTPAEAAQALDFFNRNKAAETVGQKSRGKTRGTVFSIMQYRANVDTGEVMLTQEQIDRFLERLEDMELLEKHAGIWHDLDEFTPAEAQGKQKKGRSVQAGDLKPPHDHLVVKLKGERTIRQISDLAEIPSSRVRVPREMDELDGKVAKSGQFVAVDAFYHLCQYLTHELQPEKHRYQDAEVSSNFPFRAWMNEHKANLAARKSGRPQPGTLGDRKKLLRRAVGLEGLTLEEARARDFDAYADDVPRLEKLHRDYLNLATTQVGKVYKKGSILAVGASRQGKDVLLEEVTAQLLSLAGLAGQKWIAVKPSGEHATEDVGLAEIVHHEDVRFRFTRGYDDGLRYLDANQATRQAARNTNLPAPAPRAILMSSSETLLSLGLSMKARKDSVDLRKTRGDYPGVNIDEFLFRIGWLVEVTKPSWIGLHDIESTRKEMLVSISRVRADADARVENVLDRDGELLGSVRTKHRLEPIAMIKGCEAAARFLAISLLSACSPDVFAAIPDAVVEPLMVDKLALEADVLEQRQIVAGHEFTIELEREQQAVMELNDRKVAHTLRRLAALWSGSPIPDFNDWQFGVSFPIAGIDDSNPDVPPDAPQVLPWAPGPDQTIFPIVNEGLPEAPESVRQAHKEKCTALAKAQEKALAAAKKEREAEEAARKEADNKKYWALKANGYLLAVPADGGETPEQELARLRLEAAQRGYAMAGTAKHFHLT